MPKKTKLQFSKGHEPTAGVNGKKRRSYKKYRGQGK